MKMRDYSINTKCVQGGYTPKNGEPRQIPIIQSTTFKYDTSEDMGKLFDLEASGYFYTRLQNPTNDYVAAKIAELEGKSIELERNLQHELDDKIAAASEKHRKQEKVRNDAEIEMINKKHEVDRLIADKEGI